MRILLVAPRTPDTFWSFKHALPFISKLAAHPPLGLLTVAGMLPREWECRLVDLTVRKLHDEDIQWADYVMSSAMLVQRESVLEIARRCREAGKPVIAGGPLFTPESPEEFPDIDTFVIGEAEELIDGLVADMQAGAVRGLYQAERYADITRTPIPRWDLIRLGDYVSMSVQFARGCPFNCEFCDIVALNGRVPRLKTPQQLLAELDFVRLRGWRGSTFLVDDNFIGNRKKVKDLLHTIIRWQRDTGWTMTFLTQASVNIADDPELLRLMVEAGFTKVFLGIETPDAESLQECQKTVNIRCDLVEAVRTIQRAGLQVMGGFIVGFDSDKPDIFERQFDFIQKAGVVTAMVELLQGLPRSRLYERLAREGRLLPGESLGGSAAARLNFEPKLDREFLLRKYRELIQRLYEPTNYYRRIRTFLEQYQPGGPSTGMSWPQVRALLRSFLLIGVIHRGRRAYWRFVVFALRHHPAQFGLAVTLAVYGYHFRKVAKGL